LQSHEHNITEPIMIDSPYFRFIYALRAPETRRQYPKRLEVFLDYLKLLGSSIEEKANQFYEFKDELNYIIDQSRKELLIFSSLSSLNQLFINRHKPIWKATAYQ